MREHKVRDRVVCSHCGGDGFVEGTLKGFWPTRFVPAGQRLFRSTPGVGALACRDCGHVDLWVEPETLLRALGRSSW